MDLKAEQIGSLIKGMRGAFANEQNAMHYARKSLGALTGESANNRLATLVSYDLQAGSYVAADRADPEFYIAWGKQLAGLIGSVLPSLGGGGSLLEVGVGEATTPSRVMGYLGGSALKAYGFDISWSRVTVASELLAERKQEATLFVADMFSIPLEDNSVDIVYSSHSLEPNGGYEREIIAELMRVARVAVVLAEPIYELVSPEARIRMEHHGYVRNLKAVAEQLGANVLDYRLLEVVGSPLNPSGVLILGKESVKQVSQERTDLRCDNVTQWRCPLTSAALVERDDVLYARETGIAYPKLRGVPLLRPEHAVVASRLDLR